jgi:hypothetical protein
MLHARRVDTLLTLVTRTVDSTLIVKSNRDAFALITALRWCDTPG